MEFIDIIERLLNRKIYNWKLAHIILLHLFISYSVVFSYVTIQRYLAFKTTTFDLAIYSQILWNTLHGAFMYYSVETHIVTSANFFSLHFTPLVLLLLPIYSLLPDPKVLLVIQSSILAAGIFPLYALSKHLLNKEFYSIMFTLFYLLYPPLHGVNWFDFHIEAFTPLMILMIFYALESRKIKLLYIFTILSLLIIEYTPIITVTILMIMLLLRVKDVQLRKHIIILSLLSIFYFVLLLKLFHDEVSSFRLRMWSQYGENITEALWKALHNPHWFLETLVKSVLTPPSKILYIPITVLPAFPAIFTPVVFTTLAWYLPALASNSPPFGIYLDIYMHYPAFLIGQLFASAVYGFAYIYKNCSKIANYLLLLQLFVSAIFFVTLSPLGLASQLMKVLDNDYYAEFLAFPTPSAHDELLRRILTTIPPNASVYTTNDIGSHMGNRKYLFVASLPPNFLPDYIIFDITRPYWLLQPAIEGFPIAYDVINRLLESNRYGLYIYANGIYVYKLNYTGKPVLYLPYFAKTYALHNGSRSFSEIIINKTCIVPKAHQWFIYDIYGINVTTIVYGPYIVLGPGRYRVFYSFRSAESSVMILDIATNFGKNILNSTAIVTDENVNIYFLDFSLKKLVKDLEFRIFVASNTTICVNHIRVEFVSYE